MSYKVPSDTTKAMVGFLKVFGYRDESVPLGWNITTEVQRLISSLMTVGAFVGSLIAGPMAIWLTRRHCIWFACVLCCVSNLVMMLTTNLAGIYSGRLLIGISNGLYMTFGQIYIQEVIPARYRGASIAAFNVFTSVGSLVGTVVDNFTAKIDGRNCYLIPLALVFVVPVIITIGLFFIPETPRYLVEKGKFEQARKSLVWLRPHDFKVEAELLEIETAAREEKEIKNSTGWLDLFRDPIDRRRTILSVCAVSTQAASGAFFMIVSPL